MYLKILLGVDMQHDALWDVIHPHLVQAIKDGVSKHVIGEFCGVQAAAIRRWEVGALVPRGMTLLKAWYFTKALGVKLPSLPRSDDAVETVFELLNYDVITFEEAKAIFEVTHDQGVYRIFRGGTPARMAFTNDELQEMYGEKLHDAKSAYMAKVRNALESKFQSVSSRTPVARSQDLPKTENKSNELPKAEAESVDEVDKENTFPEPMLIDLSSSLSALLPTMRLFPESATGETVRRLLGKEAVKLFQDIFEVKDESSRPHHTDDPVEEVADLLKRAAPSVYELYDDDSAEGGLARERLRQSVGGEMYNKLTVKLNAMRSRQGYERAREGAIN